MEFVSMGVVVKEKDALPTDVERLQEMVAERDATIARLHHRIDVLSSIAYEPHSERRPSKVLEDQVHQGWLGFPELIELAERVAD